MDDDVSRAAGTRRRAAGGPTTRDRILDAAHEVLHTRGLARATTKEIARAAGFSEAALYKHFADKTALFVAVLLERVPGHFGSLLGGLPGRVGADDVEAVLREVAEQAFTFYRDTFPMAASLFAEPDLLAAHRASLHRLGTGPHVAVDALAGYLAAERDRGRVRPGTDPRAAALLLLGACQTSAFLFAFAGGDGAGPGFSPAAAVGELWRGITPAS